jgi:hypothetical protein
MGSETASNTKDVFLWQIRADDQTRLKSITVAQSACLRSLATSFNVQKWKSTVFRAMRTTCTRWRAPGELLNLDNAISNCVWAIA